MTGTSTSPPTPTWLPAMRIYMTVILAANLAWEMLHLPLYGLWKTGPLREIAFAVVHCTAGDLLISTSCLILSPLSFGTPDWPRARFQIVSASTILLGLFYTIFSEWLNVNVRGAWSYSAWMPLLPLGFFSVGLSPLLQWIIVPLLSFWVVLKSGLTAQKRALCFEMK